MKIVALALATSFLALGVSACSDSKPDAKPEAKPAATLAVTAKPATSAPVAPVVTAVPAGGW